MKKKKELIEERDFETLCHEDEMAAAPIKIAKKGEKEAKTGRLFSKALFRESLHSNRLGLGIVSAGNAAIMIIIISILSTLHINSNSKALANLFSDADYENTVKSGSISLYMAYENSAIQYEDFLSSDNQVQSLIATEVEKVNDSTLNSSISSAKSIYDLTYTLTSGDEAAKTENAKKTAMQLVKTNIDNNSSYSEQEKKVAYNIFSYYFDTYALDKSKSTQDILKIAVPKAFSDVVISSFTLSEKDQETVSSVFSSAVSRVYDNSESVDNVKIESSFTLLPLLANEDKKEAVYDITSGLNEIYQQDKSGYISDSSKKNAYVSSSVQEAVMEVFSESAYSQYLPNFTVNYKTDDMGYPVTLVGTGEYSPNGTEIKKEIPVTIYNPDIYIKEDEKMGKTSNTLQKMRKELLTGEPYSEEEIEAAKKESKENMQTISMRLEKFMSSYIKREDNKNAYYDGSSILYDGIKSYVVSEIEEMSEKALVEAYNEKNDPDIASIREITVENSSMSGAHMMSLVRNYAVTGICSFKNYTDEYLAKGYSESDASLIALVRGSEGVMGELPASVKSALEEMGGMNTYGIIVGVIAFGLAGLLIPMVYSILLAKSLVAEKVETGSLAFTLSTPTTRGSFIFTQACYLLFSEVIMALSLLAASLLTREFGIWGGSQDIAESLPVKDICLYALGNFSVALAISGINFLTSSHFNKTSESIGVGGGLSIFFFICSILGLFATNAIPATVRITSMNVFNYMTIDSLFDAMSVMNGDYQLFFFKLVFLLVIAIITYSVGMARFTKKDLPL